MQSPEWQNPYPYFFSKHKRSRQKVQVFRLWQNFCTQTSGSQNGWILTIEWFISLWVLLMSFELFLLKISLQLWVVWAGIDFSFYFVLLYKFCSYFFLLQVGVRHLQLQHFLGLLMLLEQFLSPPKKRLSKCKLI